MKTYKNRLQMFKDYGLVNAYSNKLEARFVLTEVDNRNKTYKDLEMETLGDRGDFNRFTRYQVIATSAGTYGVNGAVVAIEDINGLPYYYAVAERSTLLLQLV